MRHDKKHTPRNWTQFNAVYFTYNVTAWGFDLVIWKVNIYIYILKEVNVSCPKHRHDNVMKN